MRFAGFGRGLPGRKVGEGDVAGAAAVTRVGLVQNFLKALGPSVTPVKFPRMRALVV